MHPDKFGDSYDIVKRHFLEWLQRCGTWAVHPMFSEDFGLPSPSFAGEYGAFLDSEIVTTDPVPPYSGETPRSVPRWRAYQEKRSAYFHDARQWDCTYNLLLDPDTGLWLPTSNNGKRLPGTKREPGYLLAEELCEIATARPDKLALVFDQSFSRNLAETERRRNAYEKLTWLETHGVYGTTYSSHANFVLVSANRGTLNDAKRVLLEESKLPSDRLIDT